MEFKDFDIPIENRRHKRLYNFLKNPLRENMEFKDFDIQIGIGKYKHLYIDLRETDDTIIEIDKISFNYKSFKFDGKSNNKIEGIYIENLLSFDKIEYPVMSDKTDDGYNLSFIIPYEDIINQAVKKWEIYSQNKFKSMKLSKKFEFYNVNSKILFKNARGKILIEDDVYKNTEEELEILDEIKSLREEIDSTRSKSKKEKATVANLWHLVEMTKKQIEFRQFFDENIDEFMKYDLENEEEFGELNEKLNPSISALRRYSKRGMTFSISPQADALIKEVMLKSGKEKLLAKIEKINKKEYFIE